MMDAFTGTHMERILKDAPELRHDLEGFVWYPDTLAAGPSTNAGIASILCGYDCTPVAINAQGSDPVAEKSIGGTLSLSIVWARVGMWLCTSAIGSKRCVCASIPTTMSWDFVI